MTLYFAGFLLALFGLSLILITLSVRSNRPTPSETTSPFARFFLVALRIAIGWHCFVEGMEKITNPAWSGEAYLRESSGPLAFAFRDIAGDRLIDKLTVGPNGEFPAELEREWRNFFDAFASHYGLNADQLKKAESIYEEREKDVLAAFAKPDTVTKASAYPPDLKVEMTIAQRIEEHARLLNRVRDAETKFPSDNKDIHKFWRDAKADLAKWRAELKKVLDAELAKLYRVDEARDKLKKLIAEDTRKWKETKDRSAADKLKKSIDENQILVAKLALFDVLSSEQRYYAPMPAVHSPPKWDMLGVSDFVVKWSLTVLGGLLLVGLLSRVSSFVTAILLLSFYVAMPPLPGWPEGPRLEGHYLIVNKTLIEVIALLALAFVPTGRWAGFDGLLCLCCRGEAKAAPPAGK